MFFEFGIKDIVDIVLVALMLYYIYRLMKESRSLNVFMGIMVFVVLWLVVSQILQMRLLGSIMDKLVKTYASSSITLVPTSAYKPCDASSPIATRDRIARS